MDKLWLVRKSLGKNRSKNLTLMKRMAGLDHRDDDDPPTRQLLCRFAQHHCASSCAFCVGAPRRILFHKLSKAFPLSVCGWRDSLILTSCKTICSTDLPVRRRLLARCNETAWIFSLRRESTHVLCDFFLTCRLCRNLVSTQMAWKCIFIIFIECHSEVPSDLLPFIRVYGLMIIEGIAYVGWKRTFRMFTLESFWHFKFFCRFTALSSLFWFFVLKKKTDWQKNRQTSCSANWNCSLCCSTKLLNPPSCKTRQRNINSSQFLE